MFRLASVQEQRLPCAEPPGDDIPRSADLPATNKVKIYSIIFSCTQYFLFRLINLLFNFVIIII